MQGSLAFALHARHVHATASWPRHLLSSKQYEQVLRNRERKLYLVAVDPQARCTCQHPQEDME